MGYVQSLRDDEAKVRMVLDGMTLPELVTGYRLESFELYGDTELLIKFRTTVPEDAPLPEARRAATLFNGFAEQVRSALGPVIPDRFPYVRFGTDR